jgi:hypothetical protein
MTLPKGKPIALSRQHGLVSRTNGPKEDNRPSDKIKSQYD